MYEIFTDGDVSILVSIRKLGWADYVKCMDDARISKHALKDEAWSIQLQGKPRKRWEDYNRSLLGFEN